MENEIKIPNLVVELSKKINIPFEQMSEEYLKVYNEIKANFGEDNIEERARLKFQGNYKKKLLSNAQVYSGVILSFEKPKDVWWKHRDEYIQKGLDALAQQNKQAFEEAFVNGYVTSEEKTWEQIFDEFANTNDKVNFIKNLVNKRILVPICPAMKADGTMSKMAGKPMPPIEQSTNQKVYGVCVLENSNEPPSRFLLTLSNNAVKKSIPIGKPVSFRATNKSNDNGILVLSSFDTEFIPSTNEGLINAFNKFGILAMAKKFFPEFIYNIGEITKWNKERKIPNTNTYDKFYIFEGAYVVQMNTVASEKGSIRIVVEDVNAGIDDKPVNAMLPDGSDLNFTEGSKVAVIGNPWLPKPKAGQNGDSSISIFATAIIPLPGNSLNEMTKGEMNTKNVEFSDSDVNEEEDEFQ